MSLLVSFVVKPYHGQVGMGDPETHDYPQWETGEELAVAVPQFIAVGTRGDLEGDVAVEVWSGELGRHDVKLRSVFEGELILSGEHAVVGSVIGNDLHPVSLSCGRHKVAAFTSAEGELPDSVYFLVVD